MTRRPAADLLGHHVGQRDGDAVPGFAGLDGRHGVVDLEARGKADAVGAPRVGVAPLAVGQQRREGDERVLLQVGRGLRCAAPGEVVGARDEHPPDLADPPRHQAGIRHRRDPDRHVEPFLDQVHHAIEEDDRGGHARMRVEERRDDGRQRRAAEGHGGGDGEVAMRHRGLSDRGLLGLLDVGEKPARALQETRPGLGQADAARRAVEEAASEPLLQGGDGASHRGRRDPHAARRRRRSCRLPPRRRTLPFPGDDPCDHFYWQNNELKRPRIIADGGEGHLGVLTRATSPAEPPEDDHGPPLRRHRLHPGRQGRAGDHGQPAGLCPDGRSRRQPRGARGGRGLLHRRARQLLHGDRRRDGLALHPASRRAARLRARARRARPSASPTSGATASTSASATCSGDDRVSLFFMDYAQQDTPEAAGPGARSWTVTIPSCRTARGSRLPRPSRARVC